MQEEATWTIRLAALAADNEKQTAGYVHDSSKRNDSCCICFRGFNQSEYISRVAIKHTLLKMTPL